MTRNGTSQDIRKRMNFLIPIPNAGDGRLLLRGWGDSRRFPSAWYSLWMNILPGLGGAQLTIQERLSIELERLLIDLGDSEKKVKKAGGVRVFPWVPYNFFWVCRDMWRGLAMHDRMRGVVYSLDHRWLIVTIKVPEDWDDCLFSGRQKPGLWFSHSHVLQDDSLKLRNISATKVPTTLLLRSGVKEASCCSGVAGAQNFFWS